MPTETVLGVFAHVDTTVRALEERGRRLPRPQPLHAAAVHETRKSWSAIGR